MSILGISTSISLTSFIKGGKTSKTEAKNINIRKINTKSNDIDLGIFKIFLTLFVRLQIMLAITRENIISRRKSLRLQKIIKKMLNTNNLKKTELFNFYIYFFSEYPNPFDFA